MSLTKRQSQIAAFIAKDMSTKEIAAEIRVSPRTVEEHVYKAASRLPGTAYPRVKLRLWFFSLSKPTD